MTPSQDSDPFFPPDWREQVREFLSPLEIEEPCEYGISIVAHNIFKRMQADENIFRQWEATLRLGEIFLAAEEISGYGLGAAEKTIVISTRKAGFVSPLHFWSYAMLICQPMHDGDGPSTWSWFSFHERHSQLLSAADFKAIVESQWPRKSDYGKYTSTLPLPHAIEEPMLRAWHDRVGWDNRYMWTEYTWAETIDSFVMWWYRFTA